MMTPPSHVTAAQAARILEVTKGAIHHRIKRGTFTTELWYGSVMIPLDQVSKALAAKPPKTIPHV
jgi:hypothetical protein